MKKNERSNHFYSFVIAEVVKPTRIRDRGKCALKFMFGQFVFEGIVRLIGIYLFLGVMREKISEPTLRRRDFW